MSITLLATLPIAGQQVTNTAELQQLSQRWEDLSETRRAEARAVARSRGWPIRKRLSTGKIIEIMRLSDSGMPVYVATQALTAATSISTDDVWPGGWIGSGLTGNSMLIGEWDAGKVLSSHIEFGGRAIQADTASSVNSHATHVAGILAAAGIDSLARGMSYEAALDVYKWDEDAGEMADAASNGLIISNHSYGQVVGWGYDYRDDDLWAWFGDTTVSEQEDFRFGFYTPQASRWDEIARNAPNYLIVKVTGNDRYQSGPENEGEPYWVYAGDDGWRKDSTTTRNPDGDYDSVLPVATAKNVLTVGSVGTVEDGYHGPEDVVMTSYSTWGPTDDGRIKPDLVADGTQVYSTDVASDTSYSYSSGTSMATPSVAGSMALIQQLYQNEHSGETPRSATMKALAIHTADEPNEVPGPDYRFGWGLLNTGSAAQVILNENSGHQIVESTLSLLESSYSTTVQSVGDAPLTATLVWTDPRGNAPEPAVDPTQSVLVNDLDLRVSDGDNAYAPYVMNPSSPSQAPTTGDNTTDNVEQVNIRNPEATQYTVTVDHKGSLAGGDQNFSLIISTGTIPTRTVAGPARRPEQISLGDNYPNPFNPETSISYQLPEKARVSLTVFDIRGTTIQTLVEETQSSGSHTVQWDGTSRSGEQVSSGVYFYRLQTGDRRLTKKMVLTR
ncbi:MAG: S8 family serine peptidase [Candidatus Marinimicrobia bacterium]|nr:S8 family serine peptidase [Candidatus Neomarinimicrobiota bacterium]MCF7827362.1 S8 family serine peptidase [Candidatus Neomarinimicrobiota bacterium]MCF7881405.1 S8 family serine peptidase [Candidatus Neomarinimicrobiota bacterium]